jgi:phosphoribosylaminoimidazolecarboxamide formyltransferase/IMP cyclohydrolase
MASSGTRALLSEKGITCSPIAELTEYPDDFLGGRVKTLQARIHAGILADRRSADHKRDLESKKIPTIDLVCVNVYQFGSTDQDDKT